MKESHVKGLATHDGPESCAAFRKGSGEALTGVGAGRVLSRESRLLGDADAVRRSGRRNRAQRYREMGSSPARSETPCRYGNTSHENREVVQRRLAAILAGESPVGGDCPVDTVVISGGGEGDRTVESPEVKASEREASNSAGCSASESVCLEMVDIGSGRAVGTSRRRSALIAKELGICSDSLPGDSEGDMLGQNGSKSAEPLAGRLGAPAQRRHRI